MTKKQAEETETSFLPNGSNETLEEQIQRKMRMWKKRIPSLSKSSLRTLVYKAFPSNDADSFDQFYLECSEEQFVRALRLKYEHHLSKTKLNPDDGMHIMGKLSNKRSTLTEFEPLQNDPSEWLESIEEAMNAIRVDVEVHGLNVLPFLVDQEVFEW